MTLATTTITFRTDDQVKQNFEQVCGQIGMNMSTAFNVIMRAAIRDQGLPIDLMTQSPVALTRQQQRQKTAREFIENINVMGDELTEEDYADLESGKYKLKLSRELDL